MKITYYGNETTEAEIIATTVGNWDYYANAETVYYVAKPGSGCNSGVYCPIKELKKHFLRLRNICGYNNIIPEDWKITNKAFFETLNII